MKLSMVTRRMSFEVPSSLREIPRATRKIMSFLKGSPATDSDLFNIRLSFEECLINAMKHGNGLARHVKVRVEAAMNPGQIYICVEDRGPGFDHRNVKDPTTEENLLAYNGRGIYLMKHLMDSVEYSPSGNRVEIVTRIGAVAGLTKPA